MEFTIELYQRSFKSYPKPAAKQLWVSDFENTIVHTRGVLPKKLISKRRPNEPEEVQTYREENYRRITKFPFNQAITNLQRILSQSNVYVQYPEGLKDFLNGNNFSRASFLHYFQKKVVRRMIEEANGLLLWFPSGVGATDPRVKVEIIPLLIPVERIEHYDENVLTFLSDEHSMVMVGKNEELTGEVYYSVTKNEIWKRSQTGKKGDNEFEWTLYYTHNLGFVYSLVLGGDESAEEIETHDLNHTKETVLYLSSYFNSAVSIADECLCQFSDHQGIMVSSAYPIREVEPTECTADGCHNGKISVKDSKPKNCSRCGGTGLIAAPNGPYGVIVRPKRNNKPDNQQTVEIPVMRFISPDTAILDYSGKHWQELLAMTKAALNLLFIQEAQSAIAKDRDRDDKLSFLDKVGQNVYLYLIRNSIQIIHKLRFPNEEIPEVPISLPSTFVVKNESELLADIGIMREKSAPPFLISSGFRELITKRYNADPVALKMFDTLVVYDPYFTYTVAEKTSMLATNMMSEEDAQRSILAYSVLYNYSNNTEGFVLMSIDEIITAIEPLVQAKIQIAPNEI